MGNFHSYISHNFPPKPTYSIDQIPDLTGQVIIVTGSNAGIGKLVVEQLLKNNAKVYMAARSQERAEAAIKELKEKTGKEAIFLKLDLSNLTTIRSTVEDFLSKETQLHVLMNNAGVAGPPKNALTTQGYDLQFGTNTLGHFYFTTLLIPILTSTAKTTPDHKVRVVHTSSWAYHYYPKMNYNSFKDGPARSKMDGFALYAQSKTGNILFSNELAKRYGDQGIVSISIHPGSVRSELQRTLPLGIKQLVQYVLFYPTELGALTPLYAATAPECADYNGLYITAWARLDRSEPNPEASDPAEARQLWEYMEEQVKDY
ncbi:NAD(P)-binding protein [Gymnopus androsaceus JB14]|uniref:NAD(P)-binding protein n=1 Tax=Gymnopus androsaceus JB14 TaxID=1447944 RepID=A0A6A4I426_9AGAR|nr:NAD(P)-binding protein [Gymnopus androsaceus JB14]